MQEKDGKYIFGVVKVGDKGQIVIPKDAGTRDRSSSPRTRARSMASSRATP